MSASVPCAHLPLTGVEKNSQFPRHKQNSMLVPGFAKGVIRSETKKTLPGWVIK